MGLFDSYFDPEQFEDSGGLLGRLLSLQQQQGQYQSGPGFNAQPDTASAPAQPVAIPMPAPRPTLPLTPDQQPQPTIAVGDYQMPQFGSADTSQPLQQPGIGDRLGAGFQSWAHTPVGNLFAGLANGIAGFNSGQRTDSAGLASSPSSQTAAQNPDLSDRLSAGIQSWAHTPVGNPLAALANGVSSFSSGQRSDPAAVAQRILTSQTDAAGNPMNALHAHYQALRPHLGDRNAMLAIIHPEFGRALIAQTAAGQTNPGDSSNGNPADGDQPGLGYDTNATVGSQARGVPLPIAASKPLSHVQRGARAGSRSSMPGALRLPRTQSYRGNEDGR